LQPFSLQQERAVAYARGVRYVALEGELVAGRFRAAQSLRRDGRPEREPAVANVARVINASSPDELAPAPFVVDGNGRELRGEGVSDSVS
jgi:hypothetical protein